MPRVPAKAITADLGSRTMREETDAMEVMGVSVIRRLVVPRFAAAIMVGVALTGLVCFVGFFASYVFNVYFQDGAPGGYSNEFFVQKDGPLKTLADMKGHVAATNSAGSAVDMVLRAILRKNGLEVGHDVTIIEAEPLDDAGDDIDVVLREQARDSFAE